MGEYENRVAWFRWVRSFVLSVAFLVVAANVATSGRVRPTEGYMALRAMDQAGRDKPLVVFVGSSLTQHGIDGALLESELSARGVDVHVALLAFGGMVPSERHFYLRQMRRFVHVAPAAVFLEFSSGYDLSPIANLTPNLRSARIVDMMDFTSLTEVLRWAATNGESMQVSSGLLGAFVRRYLNLGAIKDSVPFQTVTAQDPSYPLVKPASYFTEELYTKLSALAPLPEGIWKRFDWSLWQRARMVSTIGAAKVGYYGMPQLGGIEPYYWKWFCESRPNCIAPSADLMGELQHYPLWYDGLHLRAEGREIFTRWLADRVAKILKEGA